MEKRKPKREPQFLSNSNHKKTKVMDNSQNKSKMKWKRKGKGKNREHSSVQNDGSASNSRTKFHSGRHYNKNRGASSGCSSSSTSTASSSEQTSDDVEIPGFYYDPEKKKYFRILSSNNSVNVVTKEKIEDDEAERKRQKDLSNPSQTHSDSTENRIPSLSIPLNLLHVLPKREMGEVRGCQLEHRMLISNVKSLRQSGSWKIVGDPDGIEEPLEHMTVIDSTENKTKILSMWTIEASMKQRIQLMYLHEKPKSESQMAPLSVGVSATDTSVVMTWSKISNLCWAPFQNKPDTHNVLYTTLCHTSHAFSLAFIRNLDRTRSTHELFDYNLGSIMTWSSAWNPSNHRFSVGSEKRGMLVDVETRRCWWFKCLTDPFAQVFSPDAGNSLYSGGRNGMVLCHDMRSLDSAPIKYGRHHTSVCSVKATNCGNYVASSDISGKIILWDVRKQSSVQEYSGLFNKYSRVPIHLDDTEQVLYGAGQDCYTKFWCVKTGRLLKSLPPPCPPTRETIPAVQYSTRWADTPGNAGLIMGLGNKLYFYSGSV